MTVDYARQYGAACREPSDIALHLPALHLAALGYLEVRVLELGVRTGRSTRALLAAAQAVDGHVWSCDIGRIDVPDEWRTDPTWTFIPGDSGDPDLAWPEQVDVLFLDTSHDYWATLVELDLHMPRVAPGGVALFHDTQYPGLEPPWPVADALTLWCTVNGRTWTETPGSYGLGRIDIP